MCACVCVREREEEEEEEEEEVGSIHLQHYILVFLLVSGGGNLLGLPVAQVLIKSSDKLHTEKPDTYDQYHELHPKHC